MQELTQFRAVRIEAHCPKFPQPLGWEQHTTHSDERMAAFAAKVFRKVCAAEPGQACAQHDVTVLEIPQTSTGSRRG